MTEVAAKRSHAINANFGRAGTAVVPRLDSDLITWPNVLPSHSL